MNIVLFFQSTTRKSWREKLAGLNMFAQRHDWFVQVVEKFTSREEIHRAIASWHPIGCLMDRAMRQGAPPDDAFGDLPTVYLDQPRDNPSRRHSCLLHDNDAEAALIGKELLALDRRSYAYLGAEKKYSWDFERLTRFKNDVRAAGFPFFELSRKNLRAEIEALPKPCGIFGANDAYASEAYHAAAVAGFNIPNDVAIAGIDNDELFCEVVSPGITSAQPDFLRAGYRLGEMLAEEMKRKRAAGRIEYYGPLRLVRRGSTIAHQGVTPRIQRALEFIRRNACTDSITLDAVAAEMKCSKRMATLEFKKATGRTIFDAICDIRLDRACTLLTRTAIPIATVVSTCGYRSDSFIKKAFLKRTGMSMRDYRKAHVEQKTHFLTSPPGRTTRGGRGRRALSVE